MQSRLGPPELRVIYERYAPVVYRRAKSLLGNDADAWDAVQDVFHRILEAGARFRGEARPMTYIYRVTTNTCLNLIRARSVRESSPSAAASRPIELAVTSVEAGDFIRSLLESLDGCAASIAILHFVDGLTQEEISDVVGQERRWHRPSPARNV
jgi:RNA polymerase sigma-70 factor, ECF subfamily